MPIPISPEPPPPLDDPGLPAAERRVLLFTLVCIAGAATAAILHWDMRAALGVVAGGALSLINLYWIRFLADSLVRRAVRQARPGEAPQSHSGIARRSVPAMIHFGLLALVFYAIFISHLLPIAAVLTGFFSAVGGIILEAFWETVAALRGSSSSQAL